MGHIWTRFTVLTTVLVLCRGLRRLESYGADKSNVSVSGLSSGGGFSTILSIAHSSSIMGAGIFAGLPYGCFSTDCTAAGILDYISSLSEDGRIDDKTNIRGQHQFVFWGTNDDTIGDDTAPTIRQYYEQLGGVVAANLTSTCGHGLPTHSYGVPCENTEAPNLNKCAWRGAFNAMKHIYGNLKEPTLDEGVKPPVGDFYEYDQTEFTADHSDHSMDSQGYVYIPNACKSGTACPLHVSFHGCFQHRTELNDTYVRNSGYIEVGQLNNIIILFPQAYPDAGLGNIGGCWDLIGLTGMDHLTKSGTMVQIVKKIIDRVTSTR